MSITIILVLLVVLIILVGLVFIIIRKKPKISSKRASQYIEKIKKTAKLDPVHALMESHKIFITAIEPMAPGRMKAAEKVKKIASHLPNEKQVWRFHRMRNKAAHETDFKLSTGQSGEAREVFIRALKAIS